MAREEPGIALREALLDADPVDVALIGLTDGPSIERAVAAQPHDGAGRLAPSAKGREFELELGHVPPSVAAGFARLYPTSAGANRYLSPRALTG